MVGHARIVGPGAPLTALDERYVGVLKLMLAESIPGIPIELLSSVDDRLIVVQQAREDPSDLVRFEPSMLRVVQSRAADIDTWRDKYGRLLNVTMKPTHYLESDLRGASLTFSEQFFAPRSILGWMKLARHFSRLCAAMAELMALAGLKQRDVISIDRYPSVDSTLIHASFVRANSGDPLELAPA